MIDDKYTKEEIDRSGILVNCVMTIYKHPLCISY